MKRVIVFIICAISMSQLHVALVAAQTTDWNPKFKERVCERVVNRFGDNKKMAERINKRLTRRFNFICDFSMFAYREYVSEKKDEFAMPETISISRDTETHIGFLNIIEQCMIPEGCGPKMRLYLNGGMFWSDSLPVIKDFEQKDSGRLVRVTGRRAVLPASEYDSMNYYDGPFEVLIVDSHEFLSQPYPHRELVDFAGQYTKEHYPCNAMEFPFSSRDRIGTYGDKKFYWQYSEEEGPIIKVRMIDSLNKLSMGDQTAYFELWFDGNTYDFIKEVTHPTDEVPCFRRLNPPKT